jgi:hypothetical protein
MLGGLFSRWLLIRLSFTRKWLVIRMPSPMLKTKIKINKQNSPRTVVKFGRYPWIRLAVECDCWWRGSKKLYFSVWEPPIMYQLWKILGTLGCYVDIESIPLKIIFITVLKASSSGTSANPCFPLRRAYLLLLCI